MRLINTRTLVLEEYFGDQIPKYAILSHTWRDEEVSYQDWQHGHSESIKRRKGFQKINNACLVAQHCSIEYLWVDTNCINKDSSSELSEAINSMFTWYERSSVCFVYLDDFNYGHNDTLSGFEASRWFTRGWTLQELLAPKTVEFFDASWTKFGTKNSLALQISKATSIQIQPLLQPDYIHRASVARRMSWAAMRSTTREEDMAYCLLGIFEINMPLLYGEGEKAFIRLQEEIIKHSNDQTIFCWSWAPSLNLDEIPNWHGCLAPKPITFRNSGNFYPKRATGHDVPSDFQLTNSGLRINLPMLDSPVDGFKLAVLNVAKVSNTNANIHMCLYIQEMIGGGFTRSRFQNQLLSIPRSWAKGSELVYLGHERNPSRNYSTDSINDPILDQLMGRRYAILPLSSMHNDKTSWSWGSNRSLQRYGAVIALKPDNKEELWSTKINMDTAEGTIIRVNFQARINAPQSSIWDVKIQLQHKNRTITQNASLADEFTLSDHSGSIVVRPVLVSFSELLDGKDDGKKQNTSSWLPEKFSNKK